MAALALLLSLLALPAAADKRAAAGPFWLLAPAGVACSDACAPNGGCSASGWPATGDEFGRIMISGGAALGDLSNNQSFKVASWCKTIQEGSVEHDPSCSEGHCGWKADGFGPNDGDEDAALRRSSGQERAHPHPAFVLGARNAGRGGPPRPPASLPALRGAAAGGRSALLPLPGAAAAVSGPVVH
ncbi:unnamed protein product [Prorocentrum cordatum]|uniref:Cellulase n=1 Tax=Prorocentrum cordatum TaxID=2364126 RepID=A0ABN9X4K4_9DINO|nr:unnamed protein product [Polarella glacialis]